MQSIAYMLHPFSIQYLHVLFCQLNILHILVNIVILNFKRKRELDVLQDSLINLKRLSLCFHQKCLWSTRDVGITDFLRGLHAVKQIVKPWPEKGWLLLGVEYIVYVALLFSLFSYSRM